MPNGARGTRDRVAYAIVVSAVVLAMLPSQPAGAASSVVQLVSINTNGRQGDDMSGRFAGPAISGNGQVVAFDSAATTLVPGDTNQEADVFVHDRSTNLTERVSVGSAGGQANGTSSRPDLDAAGDLVVFDSSASNLGAGDTNHLLDVFVHNRATNATHRISVSSDEELGNNGSNSPSISADGRFVAFVSLASNLVPDDTNRVEDIFVRDLLNGTTERVNLASDGQQANNSTTYVAISADGRWVAFSSFASNLVPGDTNDQFDTFIHDRQTGLTELVSQSTDGAQGDFESVAPSVSGDGRFVAFWSDATTLVPGDTNDRPDVFVRDVATGTTERVSVNSDEQQADGNSPEAGVRGFTAEGPDITPDGRFVTFSSSATNLVPDDTNTCPLFFEDKVGACPDAFVRDLVAGTTVRVNVSADGVQANDRTVDPAISDDGSAVAFWSAASDLVAGDTNICPLFSSFPGNCPDIFVHDLQGGNDADLVVNQTDSRDPAVVRRRLTYSIKVTNRGPASATQVSLVDDLPSSVQFIGAVSNAGSCRNEDGTIVCDLGTLASGAIAAVRIVVVPLRVGMIANSATVSATEHDPVQVNNTDIETTQVDR